MKLDDDGRLGRALAWLATWARMSLTDAPAAPPASTPVQRGASRIPAPPPAAIASREPAPELHAAAIREDERRRIHAIVTSAEAQLRPAMALSIATSSSIAVDGALAALKSAPVEARPSPHSWFMAAMEHYSPGVGALELGTDDVRTLYSR